MTWTPHPPYNNAMFSDRLQGDTLVPQNEDRYQVRICPATKQALIAIQLDSSLDTLTSIASLALYYGRDKVQYGYNIDWQEFEAWYQCHLSESAELFADVAPAAPTFDFSDQPALDQQVYVRPKERNMGWYEQFRRFSKLNRLSDVYRVLIRYAILFYDWDVFGGNKWSRWADCPRKTVHQLEGIIEDRKQRIRQ